jgi:hypothetical protein
VVTRATVARVTPDGAVWIQRDDAAQPEPVALAGGDESDASRAAARTFPVRLPLDSSRLASTWVVYPGYARRPELARRASIPRETWMLDVVTRLRADSLLVSAARDATAIPDSALGLTVVRNAGGTTIVVAAQDSGRLLLFLETEAASLTAAALNAALARTLSAASPLDELEPTVVPDSTLASWQRPPGAVATPARDGESDGRWFWVLALALLVAEWWVRRSRAEVQAVALGRDRAA